jgi:predicted nucleic acid-binding protein
MSSVIAVIDTNVVVAGLLTGRVDSPTAQVLDGMLTRRFTFLLSLPLVAEYRSVLLRPAIAGRHGLGAEEIDRLLTDIVANGKLLEPGTLAREDPPDAADRHLWELLAERSEAVLVTGDRLLIESPPSWTRVVSPADFVRQIGWLR